MIMKKLRKLSALLVLSLIIPGYIQGATNNTEKESEIVTSTELGITESKSTYSLSETNETNSLLDSARKRHYSIFAGYTGNFKNSDRDKEKDNKYNHIIELGAAYSNQTSSKFGYSVYFGSDILFNSNVLLVGPKVGGNINLSVFMLGSEMIMYTNAEFAKVFYRPYVGVGVGPLKVTAGYNIGLANQNTFREVNSFTVGVTVPLFWGN